MWRVSACGEWLYIIDITSIRRLNPGPASPGASHFRRSSVWNCEFRRGAAAGVQVMA